MDDDILWFRETKVKTKDYWETYKGIWFLRNNTCPNSPTVIAAAMSSDMFCTGKDTLGILMRGSSGDCSVSCDAEDIMRVATDC